MSAPVHTAADTSPAVVLRCINPLKRCVAGAGSNARRMTTLQGRMGKYFSSGSAGGAAASGKRSGRRPAQPSRPGQVCSSTAGVAEDRFQAEAVVALRYRTAGEILLLARQPACPVTLGRLGRMPMWRVAPARANSAAVQGICAGDDALACCAGACRRPARCGCLAHAEGSPATVSTRVRAVRRAPVSRNCATCMGRMALGPETPGWS